MKRKKSNISEDKNSFAKLEISEATPERGVTHIILNSPQNRNALDTELLEDLMGALRSIREDPSTRVVVISGRGPAFCAGHDLKQMRELGLSHETCKKNADDKEDGGSTANTGPFTSCREYNEYLFKLCSKVMIEISEFPQPVTAS